MERTLLKTATKVAPSNMLPCCRKSGADDACFRAQSILHPPCAQTPERWSGREEDLPSCHALARHCRDQDSSCRPSLERSVWCSCQQETKASTRGLYRRELFNSTIQVDIKSL